MKKIGLPIPERMVYNINICFQIIVFPIRKNVICY